MTALFHEKAVRDAAGQWWGTCSDAYLAPITEAEALSLGATADQDDSDLVRAALAKASTGDPVEVNFWRPPSPVPSGTRVEVVGISPAVILERADGQLVAVNAHIFDGICDPAPADFGYGLGAVQLGDVTAAIRFEVGETVVGYVMPILDREAVMA